ncbi:MAG TPA: metallophosphoesterase [Methylocystis sp.]|nr:metallophosphoesterase [Methylocystis sp.]
MISRRAFLRLIGQFTLMGVSGAAYGLGEPLFDLRVKRYAPAPKNWPPNLRLRIALIADPHACEPWMTPTHLEKIVDITNDLGADCVMLLGDYVATHPFQTPTPPKLWAGALARLRAPLGVHAVLGNHDWWVDWHAMKRHKPMPYTAAALLDAGVKVYRNEAVRLQKDGRPFWVVGLDDQLAFAPVIENGRDPLGAHDLSAALAQVTDDAPIILLAHEPDIFAEVPQQAALTLCGHLHAGQCNLFGFTPFVPREYWGKPIYGHTVDNDRHLIISGGLGCSAVPMRIGAPPEIVVVDLGGADVASIPSLPLRGVG